LGALTDVDHSDNQIMNLRRLSSLVVPGAGSTTLRIVPGHTAPALV